MEEKIICAAIWYKKCERAYHRPINTPGGVVLCGHRHGNIISQLVALTGKRHPEMGESVQGFLTSKNRFVNRIEAGKIWIETGGTLKHHKTKLFSEDIY